MERFKKADLSVLGTKSTRGFGLVEETGFPERRLDFTRLKRDNLPDELAPNLHALSEVGEPQRVLPRVSDTSPSGSPSYKKAKRDQRYRKKRPTSVFDPSSVSYMTRNKSGAAVKDEVYIDGVSNERNRSLLDPSFVTAPPPPRLLRSQSPSSPETSMSGYYPPYYVDPPSSSLSVSTLEPKDTSAITNLDDGMQHLSLGLTKADRIYTNRTISEDRSNSDGTISDLLAASKLRSHEGPGNAPDRQGLPAAATTTLRAWTPPSIIYPPASGTAAAQVEDHDQTASHFETRDRFDSPVSRARARRYDSYNESFLSSQPSEKVEPHLEKDSPGRPVESISQRMADLLKAAAQRQRDRRAHDNAQDAQISDQEKRRERSDEHSSRRSPYVEADYSASDSDTAVPRYAVYQRAATGRPGAHSEAEVRSRASPRRRAAYESDENSHTDEDWHVRRHRNARDYIAESRRRPFMKKAGALPA